MKSKLAKMILSAVLIVVLVPLMGSDCEDDYYGGGFGFDYLPSFGGGDYYEEDYYEESWYGGGGYYEEEYYEEDYYYEEGWWKKK